MGASHHKVGALFVTVREGCSLDLGMVGSSDSAHIEGSVEPVY